MRIFMAGGGTGGHLFPGLALARQILKNDSAARISFIGTAQGLDLEIVPRAGYAIDVIAAGRGSPLNWRHPTYLPRFLVAIRQSWRILRRERADAVIALGGFAAAAPGIAAGWLGIPLMILEQNTIPGRVNRLLSRWAAQIFLQFREARKHFPANSLAKFYDFGSPLREKILTLAREKPCKGDALLIVGGSQGAAKLNELTVAALPRIIATVNCPVIHIVGGMHESAIKQIYAEKKLAVEVVGFCGQIEEVFRRSRLVISRSGAGSLAELAAAGLPSILIPLPSSADNHQFHNAEWFAKQGAAVILAQTALTPDLLADHVIALWRDPAARDRLAQGARRAARPLAGEEIAAAIDDFLKPAAPPV